MTELDLFVTVDAATAHLAGALGRSVWVLLPRMAEWRWPDCWDPVSPWYSSMTIYRQDIVGQWRTVVDRLARDTAAVAVSARPALRAPNRSGLGPATSGAWPRYW
jgi:ADP-heptose:LPS heptosyltransferase